MNHVSLCGKWGRFSRLEIWQGLGSHLLSQVGAHVHGTLNTLNLPSFLEWSTVPTICTLTFMMINTESDRTQTPQSHWLKTWRLVYNYSSTEHRVGMVQNSVILLVDRALIYPFWHDSPFEPSLFPACHHHEASFSYLRNITNIILCTLHGVTYWLTHICVDICRVCLLPCHWGVSMDIGKDHTQIGKTQPKKWSAKAGIP